MGARDGGVGVLCASAVGLLPIAWARRYRGTDGRRRDAMTLDRRDMTTLLQYGRRNLLYRQGKKIELFCSYEPVLFLCGRVLKQLFGESEARRQGDFPRLRPFTTDLHSLGQYIQDGERHLFETVIYVDDTGCDIAIPTATTTGTT